MLVFILPKRSTYGICANMYLTNQLNIGKQIYVPYIDPMGCFFGGNFVNYCRKKPCDTRVQGIQKQYQPYTNLGW